jgi:hypothetical protein
MYGTHRREAGVCSENWNRFWNRAVIFSGAVAPIPTDLRRQRLDSDLVGVRRFAMFLHFRCGFV